MNIFVLDKDPSTCAKYHTDKHVVKMILESVQILCSTYYFTNQSHLSTYKLTHKNHPCTIWARESLSNWLWLKELASCLYEEYRHRYNKSHKSGELINSLPLPNLPDFGLTRMAQAMPEQYKDMDVVKAYRNYYKYEKSHLLKYTNRDLPEFLKGGLL